jgi:hypothetical protein
MHEASRCRNCAATFTCFPPENLSLLLFSPSYRFQILRIRMHILLDLQIIQ